MFNDIIDKGKGLENFKLKYIQTNDIDNTSGNASEEEIDLYAVKKSFKRNRKTIIICTIITSLLSVIGAATQKPFWKGEFDIVLGSNQRKRPTTTQEIFNSQLLERFAQKTVEETLKTQVEILKSPSVLIPVFKDVKEFKLNNGEKVNDLKFNSWAENLLVNLKPNTSVLKIQYKDNNKELVLPTLKKISKIYKEYIQKESSKNAEKGRSFIKKQINLYEKLYFKSLSQEKDFANANNLVLIREKNNDKGILIKYQNEEIIKKSKNTIEQINNNLDLISNANIDQLFGLLPVIIDKEEDKNLDILFMDEIKNTKAEISSAKSYFKEKDPIVINLNEKLKNLNLSLKSYLKNHLINKKTYLEGEIKTNIINTNIISKHLRLVADVEQKRSILDALTKEQISLSLFNEINQDPWKLITDPTLFPNSLKPSKKIFLGFGVLFGLLLGQSISMYKDFRSKLIFSHLQIKKKFKVLINNIYIITDKSEIKEDLRFLTIKNQTTSGNNFIIIGDTNNDSDSISSYLKSINVEKLNIFNEIPNSEEFKAKKFTLIIKIGDLKHKEIEDLYSKIKITKISIDNLIILEIET